MNTKTQKLSFRAWRDSKEVLAQYPPIPAYILADHLARGLNPAEDREAVLKAAYDEYNPAGKEFRIAQEKAEKEKIAAAQKAFIESSTDAKSSKKAK